MRTGTGHLSNDLLAAARRSHLSLSGSGRPMSRQELAEAVNRYIHDHYRQRVQLDATYIGKLERGVHRWPNERYREALREVLGVAADAELGFFVVREPTTFPVVAAGSTALNLNGPALADHWLGILDILADWSNGRGARTVLEMARTQAMLVDAHRRSLAGSRECRSLLLAQARWYEFTSWAADNALDTSTASSWLADALSLAEQAGNGRLSSYILMRRAQQAAEQNRASDAADLAIKARREFGSMPPRTRALSFVREAHAHALLGDARAASLAINDAHHAIDQSTAMAPDGLDSHCTNLYVAGYDGYCQLLLGAASQAVALLEDVINLWPHDMRQDEVMWRTWLAAAYASSGRLPEAGHAAIEALNLAAITGSARANTALQQLSSELVGSAHVAEVRQFRTMLITTTGDGT